MKNIINLLSVVIIGGIVLFCTLRYCKEPQPEVIIKTDTIFSEVIKTELIPDTIIKGNIVLINDTIYLNNEIIKIDTIFVYLDDYLTHKFYSDTAFNDSLGLIIINDTLYRNSIKYRHVERKTYDKTKYIYSEKNGFYIGTGLTGLKEPVFNIGVDYKYKKMMIGLGINTDEQLLINFKYRIK
jgi:hypothetical protein